MEGTGKSARAPLLTLIALVASFLGALLIAPAFLHHVSPNRLALLVCSSWGTASLATVVWIVVRLIHGTSARASIHPHVVLLTLQSVITVALFGLAFLALTHHPYRGSEATQNVGAMYRGAVAYFEAEHLTREGAVIPKQFPESAPLSPDTPFCKDGPKLKPRQHDWDHPTWQALGFAMGEPHYYKYEFISRGTGASAEFTARVQGDLDCDGTYSTFERTGSVNAEGIPIKGWNGAIYIDNELE